MSEPGRFIVVVNGKPYSAWDNKIDTFTQISELKNRGFNDADWQYDNKSELPNGHFFNKVQSC